MNKELIISAESSGVEIALLENKRLVELHYDSSDTGFNVGDLYLGKIKKVMPGLNAVFVNIGHEKDAFLHYTDLSPTFLSLIKFTETCVNNKAKKNLDFSHFEILPEIIKTGKIKDVISGKTHVLVQVLKEPISSKGPRISCEISLPGRFIVLVPFGSTVNISKKIASSEERKRLQRIIESIKPKNFGVIVRTAAEGQTTSELHKDMMDLEQAWKSIQANLYAAQAPLKVLSEQNKTTSVLRDLLSEDFNNVVANDEAIVKEVANYINKFAPEKQKIVNYYKNGMPIFDHYGVNKQIKSSFGKTVLMENGSYLIIERTEAMHVVDVNSGHKFSSESQEENALQTNIISAREIARQLRLRDMGGIIIVDFIDMKNPDNKKVVYNELELHMKGDRARHSILPMSKFGLIQITRQRLRPEIEINTSEQCPTCQGSGKIRSSEVITDDIEKKLTYLAQAGHTNLNLHVHSILFSHITKGFWTNIKKKWAKKIGIKLNVIEEPHYELIQYTIHDAATQEEIKI